MDTFFCIPTKIGVERATVNGDDVILLDLTVRVPGEEGEQRTTCIIATQDAAAIAVAINKAIEAGEEQ